MHDRCTVKDSEWTMSNMKNNFTLNRADSALLARDFTLAARLYRTVLAQDPTNKDVLLKLGSTYVKAGQDNRAEGAYVGVLKIDPANFEALNSLGGVFRRLGKYDESIKVLDRALKLKDSSEVKYNMGFTYKLMEKYDEAAECFTAVIEDNPGDVLAYNHLGAIYAKRGDHKKALQTYWKGLQVDQNHPVLHYNSALSFLAQGKFDEARNSYENALRAKPGWPDAMNGLAELYIQERDFPDAQELINQALKINPENINLMVTQGRLYVKRGNYNEAESIYRSVLEKRPTDSNVMGRLERVYEKENRYDEAYNLLERMKENSVADNELSRRKIQLLINQGKLKDAGELLNKERTEAPDNPEVLNLLSQYFIRAGKLDKAHGCFKRICEVKPGYVNFLWDAALQFKRMGDYANAEDYMHKYLEKQADNAEALCTLGDIYEEQKRYDESLDVFKKILDKDGGNGRVAEAVSRVGAFAETNKKQTADMSELLSDSNGDETPEELKEKIRLYENSVENMAKQSVAEGQQPEDDSVGQDIDAYDNIDFDELLKLEYKDNENLEMEDEFSNLIMEEDSPIDFQSEEYDDRKETLDKSDLMPKDMPFEASPGSDDDTDFNPLDYNYTPKYSPSEENEMLDVSGSPFEKDDFEEDTFEEEQQPIQYPPQYPVQPQPYPEPQQYPAAPRKEPAPQQPQMRQPPYPEEPSYPPRPAPELESAPDMPFEAEPDMVPEQSPDLMDSGFEADPDVPLPEMQEPAPADDDIGEPFADNAFGEPEDTDDAFGGEPEEEQPFYEEDVEPGDGMLMPDEDIPMEAEPEAQEAVEPEAKEAEAEGTDADEPDFAEEPSEEEPEADLPAFDEELPEADAEPASEEPSFDEPLSGESEPSDVAEPDFADERESRDSAEEPQFEAAPSNEENLHRDEKTTMNLVSDALQNVVNAPVKKDFRDAADMFKTLRTLSSSLPQVQKDAFFNSLNKLKLDYVIERLSGKPGLLSAASAIRKTGGIAGMKSDNKPSLLKTMTYMRTLIKSLPDASQSWLLGKEVDKIIKQTEK